MTSAVLDAEQTTMIIKYAGKCFLIALILIIGSNCADREIIQPTESKTVLSNEKEMIMEEVKAVKDVNLICRAETDEHNLTLHYEISNKGTRTLYVLDLLPLYDYETKQMKFELHNFFLAFHEPNTVFVLQGVPPLPVDKSVMVRRIPYGTKLSPKMNLKREIEIALPLTEKSPYYSPLKDDEYEKADVSRLLLQVDFLPDNLEGFDAEELPQAKDLYLVRAKNMNGQLESVNCRTEISKTRILQRTDNFTRK